MVAGYIAGGRHGPRIVGIDVAKGTLGLQQKVPALGGELLLSCPEHVRAGDITVADPVGLPYGASDPDIDVAVATALQTAGMVCDPVYSARALLGGARLAAEPPDRIVFWHTGGAPGVFAGFGVDAAGRAADRGSRLSAPR